MQHNDTSHESHLARIAALNARGLSARFVGQAGDHPHNVKCEIVDADGCVRISAHATTEADALRLAVIQPHLGESK
ncbi:MAG: hypothetical protein ACYC26_10140 [Phycisphaerales bacterium]